METRDVRVYAHPNTDIRSYLTSEDITRPRVEVFTSAVEGDPDQRISELGTIGAQTVRELMKLPGLAKIRIKPQEVRVQKVPHASWDDLEEEILRIMERAVRKSRMHLMKR